MPRRLISNRGLLAAVAVVGLLTLLSTTAAHSETLEADIILTHVAGRLGPVAMPRHDLAPAALEISAKFKDIKRQPLPILSRIALDLGSHQTIDSQGLARCPLKELRDSTERHLDRVCRDAEVGHGEVTWGVLLPGNSLFMSDMSLVAFNGTYKGQPAILAHVSSGALMPGGYVVKFLIKRAEGSDGTSQVAENLPTLNITPSASEFVSAFELVLHRSFEVNGQSRSYLSASCPARRGLLAETRIPYARATFGFEDGTETFGHLERSCKVSE